MTESTNNTRWQWTFGLIAVSAAVVGALISFFVSTSTVTVQIANLLNRTEALERYQSLSTDRAAQIRAASDLISAKMIEMEAEFCASDVVRNLMHANDLRNLAMLWHKSFPDMIYPLDNAYYPQLCNRVIESPK